MENNQLTLPLSPQDAMVEMTKKIKLNPIETLKTMGTVIISPQAMHQIHYLLRKFPSNEWSGILVYQVMKGDLLNIQDMVCYVRYVFLGDIGSAGYTEFDTTGDMMKMFDEFPEAMDMRFGYCHSHHGMGTSFSGTDMEELQENAPQHLYYLSLIVSHRPEFSAKLAFVGQKMNTYVQSFRNIDDQIQGTTYSTNSDVVFVANMNVYQEMDKTLEDRIATVRTIVDARQVERKQLMKEAEAMQKALGKGNDKGKERAWTRESQLGMPATSFIQPSKKNGTSSSNGKIKPKVSVKKATSWNPKTKEFAKFITDDIAEDTLNLMLTGFIFGKLRRIFVTAELMDHSDIVDYVEALIDDNYDSENLWEGLASVTYIDIDVPMGDLDYFAYEAFVMGIDGMVNDYSDSYDEKLLRSIGKIASEHLLERITKDNEKS